MTVKNWRPALEETIQYITPDGVVYDLHDPPDRFVLMYEGDGFAPMDFGTTSGPYQHGETVTEVRVQPRTIDMIVRQIGCDRDAYWELRSLLNGVLRPNRVDMNAPEPGVLRRLLSNGEIRDLDCFVTKGPVYTKARDGWDEFALHESLRFTGYNPIMYDPADFSLSVSDFLGSPVSVTNIIFPFSFPFVFGTDYTVVTKTLTVPYLGNWEEYPTILVTGPATNFSIRHQTLGDLISLNGYTIAAGQTITIDLNYSRKTLIDSFGISWLGKVSDNSSLTSFRIEADPVVSGGVNVFEISCILGDTTTRVDLSYKHRYIGI